MSSAASQLLPPPSGHLPKAPALVPDSAPPLSPDNNASLNSPANADPVPPTSLPSCCAGGDPCMGLDSSHSATHSRPPTSSSSILGSRLDGGKVHHSSPQAKLDSAPAPSRQRLSRSTGQEAFRKLQKALPSLSPPVNFSLPSLPTSLLSPFSGDGKRVRNTDGLAPPPSRPPMPRRLTSEESLLYYSLSRASSLGDDSRFQDVRGMVNIRFMAFKDSLPDVPNFKMPWIAKRHIPSSISINSFFSNTSLDAFASRKTTSTVPSPSAANVTASADASSSSSSPSPIIAATPSYSSSKSIKAQAAPNYLDRVLDDLTGDVVILGGYRGSVLRSAQPPHHQLWAPVKLGFNMRKANLEVGLEDEDEEHMEESIIPSGMLQNIGPIDISRRLFKRLRACRNARAGKLRVWDFGYDWRLAPSRSSLRLQKFLDGLPSNQSEVPSQARGALVIAHSLGGLITRHAVNARPELFSGVLYAGVPQRCINILGPFRNGDSVLFNEKLLTAQVNFSIRTSFVLLPDDGFCFVDKETGKPYPIDFYNADDWVQWRLSPCVGNPPSPPNYREKQQPASTLSSLLPTSLLRPNRGDKKASEVDDAVPEKAAKTECGVTTNNSPIRGEPAARHQSSGRCSTETPSPTKAPMGVGEEDRYMNYLRRTLDATRRFRAELAHSPALESSNAYPPHAVLYGKSIPTVYAAQVTGRDAIRSADAYDDLLFRPGDGVVLSREAMLPDGYALVRAGRVSTERGHLTMLGDLPAVGRALEALLKGRRKGIGLGPGEAERAKVNITTTTDAAEAAAAASTTMEKLPTAGADDTSS